MKLPVMIVCMFLAANLYAADQAKDAGDDNAQQENKNPVSTSFQQEAPRGVPSWAGADTDTQWPNHDEGLQPSYDHNDEPSFGDDGHRR